MRRFWVFVSVVALAFSGLLVASPAQAATVKRSVSLSAPAKVTVGKSYVVSGRVTRTPKHTKVYVQRLKGRSWVTVKTTKTTSAKGVFSVRLNATAKGTITYRAKVVRKKVGKKTLKAAVSHSRRVTIVSAPTSPVSPSVPAVTSLVNDPDDAYADAPSLSADGRFVAYQSVPSDKGSSNVYVRDRSTGVVTLVSRGMEVGGKRAAADGDSYAPSISADGQRVAYESDATNLVEGDTNGSWDVFLTDLRTGVTIRVDSGIGGAEANADSWGAALSADGNHVAYMSTATNLVADDTNGVADVFVRDVSAGTSGTTTLVSAAADGTSANDGSAWPSISADGAYVGYLSLASNLVHAGAPPFGGPHRERVRHPG